MPAAYVHVQLYSVDWGCFCWNFNTEKLVSYSAMVASENNSDQISFFMPQNMDLVLDKKDNWHKRESLYKEFDSTGLFLTGHPLKNMHDFFDQNEIQNTHTIMDLSDGSYLVKIAGVIQKKDIRTSARGVFMSFILSDHFGNFEASVFNEQVMEESNIALVPKSEVLLECSLFKQGNSVRFVIESVQLLKDFMQNNPYDITLFIQNDDQFNFLVTLLKNKNSEKGNMKISILLRTHKTFGAKIKLPNLFNLNSAEFEKLLSLNETDKIHQND